MVFVFPLWSFFFGVASPQPPNRPSTFTNPSSLSRASITIVHRRSYLQYPSQQSQLSTTSCRSAVSKPSITSDPSKTPSCPTIRPSCPKPSIVCLFIIDLSSAITNISSPYLSVVLGWTIHFYDPSFHPQPSTSTIRHLTTNHPSLLSVTSPPTIHFHDPSLHPQPSISTIRHFTPNHRPPVSSPPAIDHPYLHRQPSHCHPCSKVPAERGPLSLIGYRVSARNLKGPVSRKLEEIEP